MKWTGSVNLDPRPVAMALNEYNTDEGFMADQILPMGDSRVDHGSLPVIKRDSAMRIEEDTVGNGAIYGRVKFDAKGLEFTCRKRGLEGQITEEDQAIYADFFDVAQVKAQGVVGKLMRGRENRVAAAVFNTSTWTGEAKFTDVHSSGPWATTSTDVVTQIEAAKQYVQKNSGFRANALILNDVNLGRLLANTVIRARFPGAPIITRAMLEQAMGAIFGLDRLVVCSAMKNAALEGQDYSGDYIWSSSYVMVARVIPQGASLDTAGLGRTMRWTGLMGGESMAYEVEMYDERQSDSVVVKVRNALDELILGSEYGHLLQVA